MSVQNYLSKKILSLALLSALSLTASAQVRINADTGRLALAGLGVHLQDAKPRVLTLRGDKGELLDWSPEGAPKIAREKTSTPLGKADQTTLSWDHPDGFTLRWVVRQFENHHGCALHCELVNRSGQNVRLRSFNVLESSAGALTLDGNAADWMTGTRYLKYARYYDSVGDLQARGQFSGDNSKNAKIIRDVPYDEDFTLYTAEGERGLSISAVGDQSFIEVTLNVPENGSLGLKVRSEMTGVLVEPGETRRSETILVLLEPWRDASLAVVEWIRSVIQPRGTPPIYGWCSWYCTGGNVREDHCFDTAAYVKSRRDRYPVEVLQVDEGWSIGRHAWHANKKFDRGMTALAGALNEAAPMPGVWLSPATPTSEHLVDGKIYNSPPEQLPPGVPAKGIRSFDESWYVGYRLGKPGGGLDPTSPGAREYMIGELRRLYAQGYRYFKTDFSLVGDMESGYRDAKKTQFQMQRELYSVFRTGIGEDSYLLACNGGPTRVVLGLADATRVGTDSQQKWSFCYQPNKFGKPDDVHGSWFPILQIGCASFYTHLMACDPDVTRLDAVGNLKFDPRFEGTNKTSQHYQTMETVQTFSGIQSLYGGTMMVSDLIYKPHYQEANRLRMFEIMHPVTPDKGYNFSGGTDILNTQFGFAAQRPWGNWVSMVTWNPDHKGSRDLKIHRAPVKSIGAKFHLWSFWDEKYLGVADTNYVFPDVHYYHSKLLRLTPLGKPGVPVLVGLNFHMSMGSAELKDVKSSGGKISVELVPTAGALEGQLVFHSEKPLALKQARGCEAFVVKTADNIYTAVVTKRDRAAKQTLSFAVTDREALTMEQVKVDEKLRVAYQSASIVR